MTPFVKMNPAPWTDYVAGALVTWWMTMYIAAGILERFAPKTTSWVRREVERRRAA